ncbi:hypothetical protein GCM10007199_22960 [Fictibacillus barbaricus]|nr:hypothetical protein GCM10007199_22960 [Fictibacillus barbaricus]
MDSQFVVSLAEKGVYMTLLLCGPLLALALVVGLIVSIFQATTQIQEQTLAFIPKIVAVLVGLVFSDHGCYPKYWDSHLIFFKIYTHT